MSYRIDERGIPCDVYVCVWLNVCRYGVLNITNDPHGVANCSQYGESYFILKNVGSIACSLPNRVPF